MEAWLFRIAHNLVVDHLKSKSRRPVSISIEQQDVPVVSHDAPGIQLEQQEELEELRAAISQLTEAQRQVLALRFSDAEHTSEQVALILGKKPTAVREMQSAAIKKLRSILSAGSLRDEHATGI